MLKNFAKNYTAQLGTILTPLLNAATNFAASVSFTTNAATSSGYVLNFASTTGVSNGATVTGTGIPAGDLVSSFTATTVNLTSAVATAVASGASIVFAPAPVILATSLQTNSGFVLNFNAATGASTGWTVTGTGIPTGSTVTAINNNNLTISNAVTAAISASTTITASSGGSTVTAVTSLPTPLGTTLLFGTVTGISNGATVTGSNVASATTVSSYTSTSVLLNKSVLAGGVGSDEQITFQSANTTLSTNATTGLGTVIKLTSTTGLLTGAELIESNGNTETVASISGTTVTLNSSVTQSYASGAVLNFANAPSDLLPNGVLIALDSIQALDQQNFVVYCHPYVNNGIPGTQLQTLPGTFASTLATAATAADTSNTYTWTASSYSNIPGNYQIVFAVYSATPLVVTSATDLDDDPNYFFMGPGANSPT